MFVVQAAMVKGRGGIATAVAHYARMFAANGVRSAIVFRGPSRDVLGAEGFDVLEAPPLLRLPVPDFGVRHAVRARAGGAPIVIIAHSDLMLNGLRRSVPEARIVAPCHSDKLKRKAGADVVVTLNAAQQRAARAALPARVRVAQLGNPYAPAAASAAPAPAGPVRVNFVARFIPTKNPHELLKAAHLMRARPEIRFIGDGPLAEEVRAAAATSGLNATFPGWLAAPFAAFHANDILVLPSVWEGLPYLLQEALDHRTPVIASDAAGNAEALGGGAFGALYPLGDAAALAAQLDEAVANLDPLRAKAENGRAALYARYGAAPFWRAFSQELDAIHA